MSREITSSEGLFRPLELGMPFRCRSCQKVAYPSQREDRASRALRRARGLRYRLGGSGNNLVRQYEIWKAIEDQASLMADEARLRRDVETQERAETADSQAARKVNEICDVRRASTPRARGHSVSELA